MKTLSLNKNVLTLLFVIFLLLPSSNQAQVTLPYSQNFEGNTSEWTLGSDSPNKWVVGTAAKNGGLKGLYISNDNGTTNAYSVSPSSYSQTYASFQANLTGITNAELKFDWKSMGENGYDYGDVWINTGGSDILISNINPNEPQFGEFWNSNSYTNKTISLTSYVGGVVTIKFRWRCDSDTINNPPFAIDNVTVTSNAPPVIAPTIRISSGSTTTTSANIFCDFTSAGTNPVTARGVVYGTSSYPTTVDNITTSGSGTGAYTVNLTGLNFQTRYFVRAYCTTSAGTYYSAQIEIYTLNIGAPVASSASSVGATGFTANWGSVALATGYKLDVSTSATVFTNYAAQSNFVTFDFENGEQRFSNPSLSNSNNAGALIETDGLLSYGNEPGNGGEVKKVTGWDVGVDTKYYYVQFNSQGMESMKLSSKQRSTPDGPKNFKIQYSITLGSSANWIDITGGTITCADNFTTGAISDLALPAAMENLSNVFLRWVLTSSTAVNGSTLTSAGENNIDDIIIKGSSVQTLVSGYDNLTVLGTSKAVTGLDAPVSYYYRVRATTATTTSANSNVITAVTSCIPSAQATTYLFGNDASSVSTTITFSFQAAVPAPTGYVVVRYAHDATATSPSNGTTYSIGDSLGAGTVVYAGTSTNGSTSGLSPNTEYDFYTYAYISSASCTMVYNTTSPLFGSYKTCVVIPTLSSSSSITNTGFTANWNVVSGATSYSVSIYSNSNLTQQVSGSPFTSNTNSYAATGLTPSATYYFKVKAIGPNSCDSGLSSSSSVTLLCTPVSQPFTYQFGNDSFSPSTNIYFSFQPTTIASTGYLTVVYPHGATPTAPTSGTSYTAGGALGSGTVAYSGPGFLSSMGNLTPNTVYDFYTYAFNTTQICSKEYNLVSPLFGSYSTCVTVPISSSATTITNTGFTANWSAVTGATNYTLEVFSDPELNNYVTGSPFTANSNSYAVTGLSNTGAYYYRVSANGAAFCTSGASLLQGPISLECSPSTSLAATTLATATSINSISGEFTAALADAPEGYLVVRTTTNTQPIPVNGTTYTVGSNSIGYIEYVNTIEGSWTSIGLTANTTYYYWVFSTITTNCFNAPVYSTTTKSFSDKANRTATWTGAVSDSWNTGGNWSTGSVPNSNDNIAIDSNTSNNTILDTNYTLAVGQKLTLSGTGTLTIDALSRLTIAGIADFGGKSVTIKSTSSGTGTLGQVTGTLTGATNVTVERYIPAKRAWRALTAPLIGWNSSIYSNWMNGNQSGVSNATGLLVFGPTTSWGIQMAPNYNLLTYNANNSWTGVSMPIASGTLFSSTINNAFMAFVTGPFGSSNITSGATATTLKANGTLITGSQTYLNLSSNEYKFIGNPYASPISPSAILADNANYSNIWVWDPQLASYGGYVVYSGSAYSNVSGSYTSGQPIQSGQAFFVKPTVSSDFIISESHKSTIVDNGLFYRNAKKPQLLRVNLLKQIQTQWQPFDATLVLFDSNSSNDVDVQDAAKMFNSTDNITIQNNGIALMAEHRALPTAQDYINLRISETSVGTQYKLSINTEQFSNIGLNATLEDLFTNTSLPIALDGTVAEYQFTTTSDPLSSGNRFRIVFETVLSNNFSIKSSISVLPNPFNGSNININFEGKPEGNYNYSISNVVGQVLDKGTIKYSGDTSLYALEIKNALPNGVYILNLTDDQKKEYSVKLMKQ
jgi:hypothetical protein